MNKPILLTGIRPTGDLHIGHYFSLIEPIIRMQDEYDIYVLIADLHALTELRNKNTIDYLTFKQQLQRNANNAIRILSQFVDINKLTIFKQSDLMNYHYDLFYKLLMLSKHSLTFGNPVFIDAMKNEYGKAIDLLAIPSNVKHVVKQFVNDVPELLWGNISSHIINEMKEYLKLNDIDLSNKLIDRLSNTLNTRIGVAGFATYPILMAADILLYSPSHVLVGTDQAPHLQITNELVNIVNKKFNLHLNKIKPMIDHAQTLKGNDGKKMSKTFGNHLMLKSLLYDEQIGLSWCMGLKTYSRNKGEQGNPKECLVGEYSKLFNVNKINMDKCINGTVGCVECKKNLFNNMRAQFINKIKFDPCENIDDVFILGKIDAQNSIEQNENIRQLLI